MTRAAPSGRRVAGIAGECPYCAAVEDMHRCLPYASLRVLLMAATDYTYKRRCTIIRLPPACGPILMRENIKKTPASKNGDEVSNNGSDNRHGHRFCNFRANGLQKYGGDFFADDAELSLQFQLEFTSSFAARGGAGVEMRLLD